MPARRSSPSTTSFVKPVTQIDDTVIGNGHPGTTTRTLLSAYLAFAQKAALGEAT